MTEEIRLVTWKLPEQSFSEVYDISPGSSGTCLGWSREKSHTQWPLAAKRPQAKHLTFSFLVAGNLPGKRWDLYCLNKKTSKARKKSDSNYLLQGHNLPEISRQKEGILAPRNNAAKMLFGKRIHGRELHAPDLYVLLASEQYNYCGFSALSYCLQFLEIGLEYFPLGDIYYHHPSWQNSP